MRIWLVLLAVVACSHAPDGPPPSRAFYYWRTTFQLSESEQKAIADLHVDRLYVRMFDVGWSHDEVELMGPIQASSKAPVEIVPVVFVKNEVLQHDASHLADKIWAEVRSRMQALGATPHELQIDCDWTDKTQTAYFKLLTQLGTASKLPLTATIRLHQVKYRERTGVPPVSRGTLMFYNMGKFSADPDARAIFDEDSAAKYLGRIGDYPLPLDVALPIWSWTVHVRDGSVVGLMQSTDPAELDGADLFEHTDAGYRATRSTFFHGEFLRAGDVLKTEVTGPEDTLAAAKLVAPELAPGPRTVTLFDLSERNLARHDSSSLDRVFRAVR